MLKRSVSLVVGLALLAVVGRNVRAQDSLVYISNGTVSVGLTMTCGGAIADLHSASSGNVVNADDCGREIQTALYDGGASYDDCAGCTGIYGWNPVQGGDKYGHGSPITASAFGPDTAYLASTPLEWNPDDKGGGAEMPVPSDTRLEQWVDFVGDVVHVHYRWHHLGNDTHLNALQELPAIYAAPDRSTFVYYGGAEPWTNGPLSSSEWPPLGAAHPTTYASETWGALVDSTGLGFGFYVPNAYWWPDGFSFAGTTATVYTRPYTEASIRPGAVLESDAYFQLGTASEVRASFYSQHASDSTPDAFAPVASFDTPALNATISGTVNIGGWAFDNVGVTVVEVYLDGVLLGQANLGISRPDVSSAWPGAPSNSGFGYSWNTKKTPNGTHTLTVASRDAAGNVARLAPRSVVVWNGRSAAKVR
jgi:hypothetical protein